MTPQDRSIPFNRPCFVGKELVYIAESVGSGKISGDGPFSRKCQYKIQELLNVQHVLLTTSCTDALEMSAILLNIEPGDEVIVPSYTFVSTVNAFVLHGATPVFADIRPDTLNLNEAMLEDLITDKTKAIIPVHYAGVGCEMDDILAIANKYNIKVIEDNAHGLMGKYKNKYLGSMGALATQSFHETKNVTCGEGGALIINDPALNKRAEIIREKGTNRASFFRGDVDKYTWCDVGSSYLPSDVLAAFLFAQIEAIEQIQRHRKQVWDFYHSNLESWATANSIGLPFIPEHCEQSYHMFYLLMPSLEERDVFIARLRKKSIHCVFHYLPLHASRMGINYSAGNANHPVTEDISNRIVRLPFYNDLSRADQEFIIDEIIS